MRVLLITDSLGLPREETPSEKTWVDQVIKAGSENNNYFYTMLQYGLTSFDVLKKYLYYVKKIKPHVIIVQMGIVDCCRRTMPKFLLGIISKIPIVRNISRSFMRKFHFQITKFFNFHYASETQFKKAITQFVDETSPWKPIVGFICIADAGGKLINQTYHCVEDIVTYNNILKDIVISNEYLYFLEPYNNYSANDYTLEADGHHLNEMGHSLVKDHVLSFLYALSKSGEANDNKR